MWQKKKNPHIKYTALAIITVQGHAEIVKFFLESGADVNIATSDGRNLQSVARSVHLPEEVTDLIQERVNRRRHRARPVCNESNVPAAHPDDWDIYVSEYMLLSSPVNRNDS